MIIKYATILCSFFILAAVSQPAMSLTNTSGTEQIHINKKWNGSAVRNEPYNAASKFVRSAQLHKSLSLLLLDSVKEDVIVEDAINRYGFPAVKKSIVSNIKQVTILYKEKWNGLLANIYSQQFEEDVLESILEKGERSPYFKEFVARQKSVRTDQNLIASDVFKNARTELVEIFKTNFTSQISNAKIQ